MLHRREFLRCGAAGVSFVSLAGGVPGLLARAAEAAAAAEKNDHVLVVLALDGGNDGLNTLVPFEDPLYYKNRPTLGLPGEQLHKLSDTLGLHPQLGPLHALFKDEQLAVVQGVGYPQPDRSHFRSMEIWQTASTKATPPTTGWLGRTLDALPTAAEDDLPGLALAGSLPQALLAERAVAPVVNQLEAVAEGEQAPVKERLLKQLSTKTGDAPSPIAFIRRQADTVYRASARLQQAAVRYQSDVVYPQTELGQQLRRGAQIIAGDLGTRVLYLAQGGYDTHAQQGPAHAALLEALANSVAAFQRDLTRQKLDRRVTTMIYSEFGRRVDENGSAGTDHGAASTMFLAGGAVKGGLHGAYPSLEQLGEGDLIYNTDFRSVYAAILRDWLGCSAQELLGGEFPPLALFRS